MRRARRDELGELHGIWRRSVEATHGFVRAEDLERIDEAVRTEYLPAAELWVESDEAGRAVAFMGVNGDEVESLFVDPLWRGRGIGRRMVEGHGGLRRVEVNEQNGQAVGFYERLGFRVVGRTEVDGMGMAYPLLKMERGGADMK